MLDGTLVVKLKSIFALRLWTAPDGDVTVDMFRNALKDFGQMLNHAEKDWRDSQLENALYAVKAFIDDYKIVFGTVFDNEEYGELVKETTTLLERFDNLIKSNAESWKDAGYRSVFKPRRKGRKR